MKSPQTLRLPYGILISWFADTAVLESSDLRRELSDDESMPDTAADLAADCIEPPLLALAAAGVDLDSEAARSAIETSVESIAQSL